MDNKEVSRKRRIYHEYFYKIISSFDVATVMLVFHNKAKWKCLMEGNCVYVLYTHIYATYTIGNKVLLAGETKHI